MVNLNDNLYQTHFVHHSILNHIQVRKDIHDKSVKGKLENKIQTAMLSQRKDESPRNNYSILSVKSKVTPG